MRLKVRIVSDGIRDGCSLRELVDRFQELKIAQYVFSLSNFPGKV
ncbi:unnamed protein product [Arabidopsis lyrata]|nr:unnamed protein product [Arabidopsis lyrata]